MFLVTVRKPEYLEANKTIMPSIADVCDHIQEVLSDMPDDCFWDIQIATTDITYREKE